MNKIYNNKFYNYNKKIKYYCNLINNIVKKFRI